MFYIPELLADRARIYGERLGYKIESPPLGRGLQGMVFLSSNQSAIKVHAERAGYERELRVYARLAQHGVRHIRGVSVPSLRAFDEALQIIEMSLVKPPYLVDFGGAYLDAPPPHAVDPETRLLWMKERQEKFGEDTSAVNAILAELETYFGVYLSDVHPGNIRIGYHHK